MIAVAVVVLLLAAVLFGFRLVVGPTLADRVVGMNGMLVTGMALLAIDMVASGRSSFVAVPVLLSVVGFVGTAMIARFLEGRGR